MSAQPSPTPSTPTDSKPTPKPEITTIFGPISSLQKQIQALQKQIEIEKSKLLDQEIKNMERQKMKIAKMKSFTFKAPEEEQPEIPIDGDLIRGSRLYTSQCLTCHSLDSNSYYRNTTGPALGLVYQRRNASDIFFKGYSNSLLKTDFLWSSNKLNMYLKNPQELVKGTKCNFIKGGLESEEDRVDIITFLREYTSAMSTNLRMKMERKVSKRSMMSAEETSNQSNEHYKK